MLGVTCATSAAHNTLHADGRDEHRILNGAVWPDEGRGFEVLVELHNAKYVFSFWIDCGQAHVAAELLVALLWEVLGVHDGAHCANAPVPVGINEAQVVRLACHECLDIFW